jgi:hypothetical protein
MNLHYWYGRAWEFTVPSERLVDASGKELSGLCQIDITSYSFSGFRGDGFVGGIITQFPEPRPQHTAVCVMIGNSVRYLYQEKQRLEELLETTFVRGSGNYRHCAQGYVDKMKAGLFKKRMDALLKKHH